MLGQLQVLVGGSGKRQVMTQAGAWLQGKRSAIGFDLASSRSLPTAMPPGRLVAAASSRWQCQRSARCASDTPKCCW